MQGSDLSNTQMDTHITDLFHFQHIAAFSSPMQQILSPSDFFPVTNIFSFNRNSSPERLKPFFFLKNAY
jgi:hypothetical protein